MNEDERMSMAQKLTTAIDETELAARMAEAANGWERLTGVTAADAMAALGEDDRETWLSAARAAALYFNECIESSQRVS